MARARAEAQKLVADVRRAVNAEWDTLKRGERTRKSLEASRTRLRDVGQRAAEPAAETETGAPGLEPAPGDRVTVAHLGLKGDVIDMAGGTATVPHRGPSMSPAARRQGKPGRYLPAARPALLNGAVGRPTQERFGKMSIVMPNDLSMDDVVEAMKRVLKTGSRMYVHLTRATIERYGREGEMTVRYGLRAYGPYDPAKGHRYNPHKLLIDPYARRLVGRVTWNDALYGYTIGHKDGDLSFDKRDSARFVPKCAITDTAFTWGDDRPPRHAWTDTTIYEAHVRGMTRLHPSVPESTRGTFAGLAAPAVVDYLKDLGISAIELLPVHGFVDEASRLAVITPRVLVSSEDNESFPAIRRPSKPSGRLRASPRRRGRT